MAEREHVTRLRASGSDHNGALTWNTWRFHHPNITVDLYEADLRGVDLRGANLQAADLRRADLGGADLRECNLRSAILSQAQLRMADLRRANLLEAELGDADLTEARVGGTIFATQDLARVIGLATLDHWGPSVVATDIFVLASAPLPALFLHGCGVLAELVETSRAVSSVRRVLLSYHPEDAAFATRLASDLQAHGVQCWGIIEAGSQDTDPLRTTDHAIRFHALLVPVLSAASLRQSWLAGEIEYALAQEQSLQRSFLFPITLDTTVQSLSYPWAKALLQSRTIGDFTDWEIAGQYDTATLTLLQALQ